MTGIAQDKAFFVLHGTGNNGKSTYISIMQAVLGPYAVTISPDTLTRSYGRNPNNVNADIARTRGARAIFAAEPSEKHFDQGLLKKLTQGDVPITGVFKGHQPFDFLPTGKLVLEVNQVPEFDILDRPFIDRMHLIHFSATFPLSAGKNRRQLLLPELPQIFSMQLQDACRVVRNGLSKPLAETQKEVHAIRSRQARNDGLEPFLEEFFYFGSELRCTLAEIESTYRPWSEHHRMRALPRNHLSRQLCEREGIERGNDPKDHKTPAWLKGLGLKTASLPTYAGRSLQYKEPIDD
jgi:putative DNA primase/helicase